MFGQQRQIRFAFLLFLLRLKLFDDIRRRATGFQVLKGLVIGLGRARGYQPPPQIDQFFSASSMTLPVARAMASRKASKYAR